MKGHGAKYGRKQEEAIAALLTQRNIEEAAKSIGIDPTTLLRWLKLPEFQTAYRDARRAAFSQSIARLQQGSTAAATTLLKIMLDQNTPASTRVRAAECIMNHTMKAVELEDVEVRVADLERAAQISKSGGKPGVW
jgi:transposase-like protein